MRSIRVTWVRCEEALLERATVQLPKFLQCAGRGHAGHSGVLLRCGRQRAIVPIAPEVAHLLNLGALLGGH